MGPQGLVTVSQRPLMGRGAAPRGGAARPVAGSGGRGDCSFWSPAYPVAPSTGAHGPQEGPTHKSVSSKGAKAIAQRGGCLRAFVLYKV